MREYEVDPAKVSADGSGTESSPFPLKQFIHAMSAQRRTALAIVAVGFCLSLSFAIVKKQKYTSNVLLMPPDSQTLSTTSSLAALTGAQFVGGFAGGGLLNARTPGSTIIGILGSRSVQDSIIDRLNLTTIYPSPNREIARLRLAGVTETNEDKKTGLLSIAVTDVDPHRARDIANTYVVELNRALNNVNTSAAHRERVFLEERLKASKSEMDELAGELSKFSSKTGTLNPQMQGQALFETAARLQAELGAAQAQLSGLRATYNDDNARVRTAKATVDSLSAQLSTMRGSSRDADAGNDSSSDFPSLRQLPYVGVTYANLSQRLTAQQTVYGVLLRQYELARVEEAKLIPAVKVLDEATVPSKPSTPSRAAITILGTFVFIFFAVIYAAAMSFWTVTPEDRPIKMLFSSKARI